MPQGCGHHGCGHLRGFPPDIVSIYVRAGWTMGWVKDKYLKRENMRAQHIGRCARYLNQLEKEFDVTPPYFPLHTSNIRLIRYE